MPFNSVDPPYSRESPHRGADFAYLPDNKIYAPFSGRVTLVPNNKKDGNGIYMADNAGRFHGLLHTSKYLVDNHDLVDEGQPIGIMGDTGEAEGVHLHWAVKENGQFIDPMSLITKGEDVTTEDQVRMSILGVTGNTMPADIYEKEVHYWTGRSHDEFAKYIYALGDSYILAKLKEVESLKRQPASATDVQISIDASKYRQIKELLK